VFKSAQTLSVAEFGPAGWQVELLTGAEHEGFQPVTAQLKSIAIARLKACITDLTFGSLYLYRSGSPGLGWTDFPLAGHLKNGLPDGKCPDEAKPAPWAMCLPLSGIDMLQQETRLSSIEIIRLLDRFLGGEQS
jgi:hypothetical protein